MSRIRIFEQENRFTHALTEEELSLLNEKIKKCIFFHWNEAFGEGICSLRVYVMRIMAEKMFPKKRGAFAYIDYTGIVGPPQPPEKMSKAGYVADLFRPLYVLPNSRGFRDPVFDNVKRFSAIFIESHTALVVNIEGEEPKIIDFAFSRDLNGAKPFKLEEWLKTINNPSIMSQTSQHGYFLLHYEWYP